MGIFGITSGLSGINSTPASSGASQSSVASFASLLNQSATSDSSTPSTGVGNNLTDPAVINFMKYMKETPAQRFVDSWLAAHHLTEADLKKMSPEQRAAIMKEIAQDMKAAIENETQKKTGSLLNVSS